MTLREDLIAAKALIDTPEKFARQPLINVIEAVCLRNVDRVRAVNKALAKHSGALVYHDDFIAAFDRAIEAAS